MERLFLCLLCLSGWSVSSCLPRQYHYVEDPMTWTEAQTYCRKKYTDLATVQNTEETDQLESSVPSDHRNGYVWIGLYSNIQWKWSDGYKGSGSDYRKWDSARYQPDFVYGDQRCVAAEGSGVWWNLACEDMSRWPSVCNNGTQQDPDFIFVNNKTSWPSAQRYCRENYVDLATVKNDAETQKIQTLIPRDFTWIGLYRDPEVFWSDGSGFSFQFWGRNSNPLGSMSVVCGAADLTDAGKWRVMSCEDRFPFVCDSSEKKIHRQVIKLRMKPDDPSLDLNDPAVKEGLLRELQDRLKESGLSGVTLKWREQPDGKVFHKEGESSQKKDRKKREL